MLTAKSCGEVAHLHIVVAALTVLVLHSSLSALAQSSDTSIDGWPQPAVQPAQPRATFRPLNRLPGGRSAAPPPPPQPQPPATASIGNDEPLSSLFLASGFRPTLTPADDAATDAATDLTRQPPPPLGNVTPSPAEARVTASETSSVAAADDEQPTRLPMNRFRPTRPPSADAPANQPTNAIGATSASGSQPPSIPTATTTTTTTTTASAPATNATTSKPLGKRKYDISNECFECICEASTSCNAQSRCQTSDVRHTRCGLYLISYDQWLETGLSSELVTAEALANDPAADERAFYECVTSRECAERLMTLYMDKHVKDCDKDGRLDCYDVAAVHQGGADHCASESLLDSQYWSDFNACFGFGR